MPMVRVSNGGTSIDYGDITLPADSGGVFTINLGYKPKKLLIQFQHTGSDFSNGVPLWMHYDETISTTQFYASYQQSHTMQTLNTQWSGIWKLTLTNTGFTFTTTYTNYVNRMWYFADKN